MSIFSKNHIRVALLSFWGKRRQALQTFHRAAVNCALFCNDTKSELTAINDKLTKAVFSAFGYR